MSWEVLWLVPAALVVSTVLAQAWRRAVQWRRWRRFLLSRPGMALKRDGLWRGVRVVHSDAGLVVDAVARTRPRDQPVWELSARPLKLGRRTTLSIGREGTFNTHSSQTGWQDPRAELADFDKRYRIGGSATGVVRAAVSHPDVRHAVVALFERRMGYVGCQLKGDTLSVVVTRDALEPEETLGWVHAVRGLAEALNQVADISTLPPPARESGLPPDGPGQGSWIPRPASVHGGDQD